MSMAEDLQSTLQAERGRTRLSSLFHNGPKDACYRCKQQVYQAEKIGPVKGEVWHKTCFKCSNCGQNLTLKNYQVNQTDAKDKNIYCSAHVPKVEGSKFGPDAVVIRRALTAPKAGDLINEQIHKGADKYNINADALHIKGALQSQLLQKNAFSNRFANKHNFPAVLVQKQQEIFKAQEELERLQREEEDRLYKTFQAEREQMQKELTTEIEGEWEKRLEELTARFDSEMKGKKKKVVDRKTLSSHYEREKDELQKNMTIKRQKKKQNMTLKLIAQEQEQTSDLVKKHSAQMLELIQQKKIELQRELEQELMKQQAVEEQNGQESNENANEEDEGVSELNVEDALVNMISPVPGELPPPRPASCRKSDIYTDPAIFKELDEHVFSIAEAEQASWTDLVSQLTSYCITDLEKVRSIFRWLTVKDLNVIDFEDDEEDDDTPVGLLRGIKLGTETYHVLFMRLCSFSGIPCVEIKGHSKSVGYEPGMRMRSDTFQNTWNAVLIAGDWRLVQCNWGARHLVLNKDMKKTKQEKKTKTQDKIRYQYDEHYFLTDADEFIQEFWPVDRDWQLLHNPITLEQFIDLPFVRSIFFHYGMKFEGNKHAVLYTDSKGGVEIKIKVPRIYLEDIVFHYQLRFADREFRQETEYKGAKLERFVFHSIVDDTALFSVHVPTMSDYFLEIFANRIDETNKIGDDPSAQMMPFRLKCACKFKVVCTELMGKMHPLPNCASGEWGPWKGLRHFNIRPITNRTGVLNQDNGFELQFELPRKLHFLTKLRANGVDDHILDNFVSHSVVGNIMTVRARMPQPGQYGLDIYARREDAADSHTLAHACKYLINCAHVKEPVELPVLKVDHAEKMTKDKWGPSPQFEKFGLKALSHRDPKIHLKDAGDVCIVLGVQSPVQLTYHLIREPDEDHRDHVNVVREDKKSVKFFINLSKHGHYLFAVYARKDGSRNGDQSLVNVYNYMIRYGIEDIKSATKSVQLKKSFFKR
ncbi:unnamed protein product [Owenia fusiformis]|uniref:Uncharacterized protein n=1 Tax=Owenia fusiformis TaxID=6347 RepID=A0A8J1Y205_OWEFU|nr:unnamed protein product [Owenia fusiformis]